MKAKGQFWIQSVDKDSKKKWKCKGSGSKQKPCSWYDALTKVYSTVKEMCVQISAHRKL